MLDHLLVPRSQRARPPIELDPEQERAVALDGARSLLVLGEAGYGKTTVALHRLARLEAEARAAERKYRGLVLVPTELLAIWAQRLLDELGARRIEVRTFDRWVLARARDAFPGLPKHDSADVSVAVMRLKRHPALRLVLPEIAKRSRARAAKRIDLLHLFGDRALMELTVEAAGDLPRQAIDRVLEHTHVQFSQSIVDELRVTDKKRLRTLDGRDLDDGTPLEDADTIDAEDCAVLFEIQRLRTGAGRAPDGGVVRYDHIVLDEAQELAPIELAVVRGAIAPKGAITVAGDAEQHTDDTASFCGWDAALEELGCADAERVRLLEGYRCPPAITAFARGLVGRGPRIQPGGSPSLVVSRYATASEQLGALIAELSRLTEIDPDARIAVICASEREARNMQRRLLSGLASRLAVGRSIDLLPGVLVASVTQVKGLEFDYVVIPEADLSPPTIEGRRALYVAVTRALHQVWIHESVYSGKASSITTVDAG